MSKLLTLLCVGAGLVAGARLAEHHDRRPAVLARREAASELTDQNIARALYEWTEDADQDKDARDCE